jgi:actin related protein 2/3 complex, subunit 3
LDKTIANACGIGICPLKSSLNGPAPKCDNAKEDVVDEAIKFYRVNILMKNFNIEGPADRTLIYLTVYLNHLLGLLENE